jgi:hypothetical protein
MRNTFEMAYTQLINSATHDLWDSAEVRGMSETVLVRPLCAPDRETSEYAGRAAFLNLFVDGPELADEWVLADVCVIDGVFTGENFSDILTQFLLVTPGLCDCQTRSLLSNIGTVCRTCVTRNDSDLPEAIVNYLAICTDLNAL